MKWRRIDAELAELLSDSILDDAGLELVHSEEAHDPWRCLREVTSRFPTSPNG